jgi:hypothetical protein
MLFKETVTVYPENDTKPINTLCGYNAELLNVESGITYKFLLCFEQLKVQNMKPFIMLAKL